MIIIGEVFSLLAALSLAYSTFSNKKDRMILWQAINATFYGLSNFFLGGYTAVVTNILTLIRNILQVKGKMNKGVTIIICILMTIIGFYFNKNGILGLIPIIASVTYTICVYVLKSAQQMRVALIINLIQWLFFDFLIKAYPMFVMDLIIIIVTLINILRYKEAKDMDGKTKVQKV